MTDNSYEMLPELELGSLHPLARKIIAGELPKPMRLMAAKGVVPGLPPDALVTVVSELACSSEDDLRLPACEQLAKFPFGVLKSALDLGLPARGLHSLATHRSGDEPLVELLLKQPALHGTTLKLLATGATESLAERIAINESLLLKHPDVISAMYMNKSVRMSTADRLLELAVRHNLKLDLPAYKLAAEAIKGELIAEPTKEPSYDDVVYRGTTEVAEQLEANVIDHETHELNDEGQEQVKGEFLPLHAQIAQMTVTQKIRKAILGTTSERMLLVRDTNRLVASAAASSPMLNENDAARIAASRNVIDDVLRIIAQNRSFTRSYQVKINLVQNPRTPFTFSSRMIAHLRDNDLRSIVKSRNVPANVRTAARQQLSRKKR